ncbi:tRNA(Ile)-lysidine synthase [Azorhizobium oxalatiphilum]|uniref:tRNA(Ile)-lysidine synthase n=1 Tax=Azorhizobium oxalatiphilum TaxID=980631 RepID=A0A917F5A5_9HYPH|nr:tRNA(Ile)-lysidine synthase [Azorhizobium oxalatiphilum]
MQVAERPGADPILDEELEGLFGLFRGHSRILLGVSGGPDSTALLLLARNWRYSQLDGPSFCVATVDHGLRPGSDTEAAGVGALCENLGMPHVVLPWRGPKPGTRIQEAARDERYTLLKAFARENRLDALALAHTLDDQAETVLFRLCRGSGIAGLAAMRQVSRRRGLTILRPFLDLPKARLVATLEASGTPFVRDPSNSDPRFTRPRLRMMAPVLESEGLDAQRLALLARRAARADAALELQTDTAQAEVGLQPWGDEGPLRMDAVRFFALPDEIALRLLMRGVMARASEGTVELAKAERLLEAFRISHDTGSRLRRTLAGAVVTLRQGTLSIVTAPLRQVGTRARSTLLASQSKS